MDKQRTLVCPHCGCDDLDQMTYVEEALTYRSVLLVDGDFVVIETLYTIDDCDGPCHFHCGQCEKDYPTPDWAELEFDDNYEPSDEEVT